MLKKKNGISLTHGDERKIILKLSVPMFFGLLSVILFSVVDTIFISYLGTEPLAAISFTFPVVFSITSIAIGLGVGTSAMVSRFIGKGDLNKARQYTAHGLLLALLIVTLVAIVGLASIETLFKALGANNKIISLITSYMVIWYTTVPLIVIPMVGNSAIRATGDSKTPAVIMSIAGICNIILDPLLIFGWGPFPKLGIQGAAIATAISYTITLFWSLWVLIKREELLIITKNFFDGIISSFKEILVIAAPVALTNMLLPLTNGVLTKLATKWGEEAVAAFGASTRIEALSLIGVFAVSSILTPFVGQNLGANLPARIKRGIFVSFQTTFVWCGMITIILLIFAPLLAGLFSDNNLVRERIISFCWIVPFSFGFYSLCDLSSSGFNGLGRPYIAASLLITRMLILTIPLTYIATYYWGFKGIFIGKATANVVIGVIAYLVVANKLSITTNYHS